MRRLVGATTSGWGGLRAADETAMVSPEIDGTKAAIGGIAENKQSGINQVAN